MKPQLQQVRSRLGLALHAVANRRALRNVRSYCFFVGYERSGHSLLGSLLDAHPNVVIAHELDALQFVERGESRTRIFTRLVQNARYHARSGRSETRYSYAVAGQWQGAFSRIDVIGDKKGGRTALRIAQNPDLLDRLAGLLGEIEIKFVHVIRNPFDNISTIALRTNRTIAEAARHYFRMCDGVKIALERLTPASVLQLQHETLLECPRSTLVSAFSFLGVEPFAPCVAACTRIVQPKLHLTRFEVHWPTAARADVGARLREYDYLAKYSFEDSADSRSAPIFAPEDAA